MPDAMRSTVMVDGVEMPCLAKGIGGGCDWWFAVPMENGWVAWVQAYERRHETEYRVRCVTPEESERVLDFEIPTAATVYVRDDRPPMEFPRSDRDLRETLVDLSRWPSPRSVDA